MADIEIPDEARAAFVPLLNAIADQQHEHLCNCGAYPDGCVSEASYTRESLVAGLYNAESGLEEAWRQGWRPTTDLPGPASMVRDLLQAVYPGDPMPDRPLDTIWNHLIEQVTQQTARMDVRVAERDDALTMVFEQGTRYRAEIAALRRIAIEGHAHTEEACGHHVGPLDVVGASACSHCGEHYASTEFCPERCDIAGIEVEAKRVALLDVITEGGTV